MIPNVRMLFMKQYKSSYLHTQQNDTCVPTPSGPIAVEIDVLNLPDEAVRNTFDQVDPHLIALHSPAAFETEQYRILAHQIEQMHQDRGIGVIAISSPMMGDGKTTTALNLTVVLGQMSGMRILLIETDLRRPAVELFLGIDQSHQRSLAHAITNPSLSLQDVITWCAPLKFALLPAGHSQESHHELLASARLGELVQEARLYYDCIIVDTPPLMPFADCRVISKWVDGFLVVVSAHKTPQPLLEKSLGVINPDKLLGFIFNQEDNITANSYADYYYARPSTYR